MDTEKVAKTKRKKKKQAASELELGLLDNVENGGGEEREDVDEEASKNLEKLAEKYSQRWRIAMLVAIFAVIIPSQVHAGVKTVVFEFTSQFIQPVALTSVVIWTNIELFLARRLINVFTREQGHYYPQLHPHPLYYDDKTSGHSCDACRRRRLKDAYRCDACDYDLCLECVRRNKKATFEGLVRTDKGIIEDKELSNWEYLKKASKFAKNHIPLITLAILFLPISSVPGMLLPNYQGEILDSVVNKDRKAFGNSLLIFICLTISVGIAGGIKNLCFNVVGKKMLYDIQRRLFSAIMRQDIAFFDGVATGDLTSRLWNDAEAMLSPISTALTALLSASIMLAGGLVMCFYTSWRLSILAFTTVGPITLLFKIYAKWSRQINKEIWAALSEANAYATEAIGNIRTVRAFSQELQEETKYNKAIQQSLKKGIQDAFAGAGTFALTSYMEQSVGVLILWYGGALVLDNPGELTFGKLVTFQLYWNMINSSYTTLSGLVNSFTRAGGAAQRIMSLLDTQPDIDPTKGEPVDSVNGEFKLENVEFHYQMRPEQKVLKGINLTIEAGKVCALVGQSGGGKSTLISLLMRFYDVKSGRILLDGTDLRDLCPLAFRKHIGIVAQDTQLFNMNIEDNIAYGVDKYTKEELIEAAKLANAHDFISSFDEGYQTRIGERGTRLSGGQKQRIALARVFLKKPSILFLDEATSSLDAESEALVQEAIDRLIQMRKCTVLLVAHRLSTVINADKIAVVGHGSIQEVGTHEQLLKLGGIYSKLVKRQVQRMQNTLDQGKDPSKEQSDVIDALISEE